MILAVLLGCLAVCESSTTPNSFQDGCPECEYNNTCIDLGDDILETPCKKLICKKIPVGPEFNYKLVETTTGKCCVRGDVFDNTVIFTRYGETDCVKDLCWNGTIIPWMEKCQYNDACVALGTIVSIRCEKFTCAKIQNETKFTYKFIEAESGNVSGSTQNTSSFPKSIGSCCVKEQLFDDKEIFTPPGDSNCVRYKCSKGNVIYVTERCQHNNTCYDLGATIARGCKNFTCIKVPAWSEYSYQWNETIQRCEHNNTCFEHGDTIDQGCETLECSKYGLEHGYDYRFSVVHMRCEHNNKCYEPGDVITKGCKILTCKLDPIRGYRFQEKNTNYTTDVTMDKNLYLAFVYGTLKSGEANHHQLFAKGPNGSVFVGHARTVSRFPLIVTTPFNIPFLLHKEGSGHRIKGELYVINNDTLKHLDMFEGHPHWYERRQIKVELLTDSVGKRLGPTLTVQAWLYALPRFKNSLLELPQLEVYNEKELEIHQRLKFYNPETDECLFPYLVDS